MRSGVDRSEDVLCGVLAFASAAVFLIGVVLLGPDRVYADETLRTGPACGPGASAHADRGLDLRTLLTEHDQIATLQAVHFALSEVPDGASYVWHRSHGRLSGVVQITQSLKGGPTGLCRAFTVTLTSGDESRRLATAACRLADRSWQLSR